MARDMDFLYVSSRVRALETKLLTANVLDRILEAESTEEAFKVLGDTEYGNELANLENVYDFETVLESSLKRTYKTIRDSLKDRRIVDFFTLRNDYHNLKVILKQKIVNQEVTGYLSKLGQVPVDELRKMADEDITAIVPDSFKRAFAKAWEAYEATQEPQQIDIVIDKALFEELKSLVEEISDDLLQDYFDSLSDLTNIKTMIRLKYMDSDVRVLENALLPGGKLDSDFFLKQFTEQIQAIIDALMSSPYQKVVEEGLLRWVNTGSPALYERLADNYLLNLVRAGLYKPFGPEPVIGYLVAKEYETNVLRILLVGKINGISSEMIKERLRDVYV
ncbi:MAG: V-type ATP synthase subunit C [Tepidanaerobacteraceae bacterium]